MSKWKAWPPVIGSVPDSWASAMVETGRKGLFIRVHTSGKGCAKRAKRMARLIAAAPAMLEALEAIAARAMKTPAPDEPLARIIFEQGHLAEDAIAKAKEKSQ